MKYSTKERVRYSEVDQMGVVYYGNYYRFYEIGRVELMREMGIVYAELESQNILLPVLEAGTKYIGSAHYDEEIEIISCISELKGVRIRFKYEIFNSDKQKINEGFTLHVFTNKELKPVRPPKWVIEKAKIEK